MVLADDRILEYLESSGPASPSEIFEGGHFTVSQTWVSERCRRLADEGLIQRIAASVYDITEEGEGYLDEEFNVQNWTWMNDGQATNGPSADTATEPSNG